MSGSRNAVSIVVPTYNERESLPVLVDRLEELLTETGWTFEIVVVDDDSPDRTWELAESLGTTSPVRVIRRQDESGLATAVVRGMDAATHDVILVMDADLQHPPERVTDILAEIEDFEVVVGSRFVDGGSVGEFSLTRHLMSVVANYLARLCFPSLWSIRDLQSGFFAIRRSVIEGVDLRPVGYKILLELLVRGSWESLTEVGYEFDERIEGASSMTTMTIVNYLRHLLRLRFR
jgi:dolichol-phosphate mannosyltransferase